MPRSADQGGERNQGGGVSLHWPGRCQPGRSVFPCAVSPVQVVSGPMPTGAGGLDRWTGSRTNSTHPGVHWTVTRTDGPVRSCYLPNDQRGATFWSGCRSTDLARDVCASTWSRLLRACPDRWIASGIGRSRRSAPRPGEANKNAMARRPTPPVVGDSSRPGVDRIRTVKVQVRGRVRASAWPLFCQTGPPCSVCSDEKERTAAALG